MRKVILTAAVLGLALPAWAQEEEEAAEGGETEGAAVADEGQGQVKIREGARETAPGEVHTVVRGDTLWDLSQRYLGTPWYWPKVWSYNPEIANPHWIYPGNLVRFFPGGEEAPTQVEAGVSPDEMEQLEASEPIAADEMPPDVSVAGKIGYTPQSAVRLRHTGFVTQKELDEAGRIESSFAEPEMLSTFDTVYLSFKRKSDAKVGDTYVVFETLRDVTHPITGSRYGYLTKFLGAVKVTQVSDKLVTAEIVQAWDEINRGDLIGPYGEALMKNVSPRANERELKGHVITTMVPFLSIYGEHHMVVVDKGSSDGVVPGNTFTVVRQNDPKREDVLRPAEADGRFPLEDIATCMAIDVKDKATTCLLTRSIREVVRGDRVWMKPSGSAMRASLR